MQKAVCFIKSSRNILILTHKSPDGDAVGSVLGLAEGLRSLNKDVICFSKDTVPRIFEFLPNVSTIKNNIDKPRQYDLVILLDCSELSRTGIENISEIANFFDKLLIIDHHPKDKIEHDYNRNRECVIDERSSSTAILIYRLLTELDIKITKDIANCLLTGIFTDTGGFQHNNTDSQSLEIAAELMKKGPRINKISKKIFNNKNISAIKLWGKALSRVKTDDKTGMAVSYVTKKDLEECKAKQEDIIGLVSIINTISDAKFSLLLTEYEDQKLKGSLRSEEYKGIDVSRIAKSFGGGGHKFASGFEINGRAEESISKIRSMILRSRNNIKRT